MRCRIPGKCLGSGVRAFAIVVLAGTGVARTASADDLPPYAGSHDDASYGEAAHATITAELPGPDQPMASALDDVTYPAAARVRTASGRIVMLDGKTILLRSSQRDVALAVDAQTPITIDGKRGSFSELQEGMEVRASYREGSAAPVRIEARRQAAAEQPSR